MKVKTTVKFDRIKKLQEKLSATEVNTGIDDTCQEVEDMWASDAHVITGFMQSRVSHTSSGPTGTVFCDADYAIFEIGRGGPHDFTVRGLEAGPTILKTKMEELIKE